MVDFASDGISRSPVIDEEGSSYEKCGFAVHILTVVAGCLYFVGLATEAPWFLDPQWTQFVPTALVALFVSAPILYAALNGLSAASPESMDCLRDDYTREPTAKPEEASAVPAIYDLNVADVNDMIFRRLQQCSDR